MSLAKTNTVKSARKDQGACEKCGDPLPKGSAYLWYSVGFRSRFKHKRCTKPECYPRPSERESSKIATIMEWQEDFDPSIYENVDDIRAAVTEEFAGVIEEIAQEYRDAGTNDSGVEWNTQSIERADELDNAVSELQNWEPSASLEGCEDHETNIYGEGEDEPAQDCEACQSMFDDYIDAVREEAQEAVNSAEI